MSAMRGVRLLSILLTATLVAPAFGQTECPLWLDAAREHYRLGRFEAVLARESPCLERAVPGQQKEEALRLLALTLIALDREEGARQRVRELIKVDPEFEPHLDDPADFRRMVEEARGRGGISVYSVSKSAESLREAPAPVVVVTAKQIEEWGSRDLKDVLRRAVPGFQVIADRDEWVFAARGNLSDNNAKYLILIDGHRVNSAENFGPGQIIEMPNDLSNVKQIEIIKGPGSAIWGSDALAGVISIITKDVEDLGEHRRRASVTLGEDGTYKANFQLAHVAGKDAEVIFMGSTGVSDGTLITQSRPNRFAIADTETRFLQLVQGDVGSDLRETHPFGTHTTALDRHDPGYMLQLKARLGRFLVNAFAFNTSTHNRQFEADRGRETFLVTNKYFGEGVWSRELASGMDLTWKISTDHNRAEYLPKSGLPSLNIAWIDRRASTSVDVRRDLGERFHLSAGAEYVFTEFGPSTINTLLDPERERSCSDPRLLDPALPEDRQDVGSRRCGSLFDEHKTDYSYGSYFMLDFRPSEKFKLTGGGRLNFNSDRGAEELVFTPRLALIWLPSETHAFKILYNSGFLRPANFQSGGGRVDSETMNQIDLVYLRTIGEASLTATLYWQRLEDFITLKQLVGGGGFANVGDYESQGLELELAAPFGHRHDAWLNLAWSDAEQKSFPPDLELNSRRITPDGKLLNYAPFTLNAGATIRFGESLYLSPAVRFVGETDYRVAPRCNELDCRAEAFVGDVRAATYAKTDAFTYLDVNVGFDLSERFGLTLYVDNVFDEDRQAPLSVWNGTLGQYGRYAELKLRLRF